METVCFCFDIDGTLYSSEANILPSTMDTIQKLKKQGHKIVVATGRNYGSVKATGLLDEIHFDALVLNNGQCVLDDQHQILFVHYMEHQLVEKIIEVSNAENLVCSLETMEDWFLIQKANDDVRYAHEYVRSELPPQKLYDPSMNIIMALVYAPKGYDYRPFKQIEGLNVDVGNSTYADLDLCGFHKYVGIEKCLEHFHISKAICFGDGRNDIEMLRHAHIGIAMGQSAQQVKEAADFVTTSCDEDGIFHACRHYHFI